MPLDGFRDTRLYRSAFPFALFPFLLLLLLRPLAIAQQPGSDGIGDRLFPQMGNGGNVNRPALAAFFEAWRSAAEMAAITE